VAFAEVPVDELVAAALVPGVVTPEPDVTVDDVPLEFDGTIIGAVEDGLVDGDTGIAVAPAAGEVVVAESVVCACAICANTMTAEASKTLDGLNI
jgi:hypothetical protein